MQLTKPLARLLILITTLAIVALGLLLTRSGTRYQQVHIGVLTSLTGQSARYGVSALNGIRLAQEEINASGGINGKHISLIVEDDGSDTSRAVSAFTKLATIDNVPVVIGPISSSAAMACSAVANKLEVVLFSPSAATPAFSSPNDYTFRNRVSSDLEISTLADVAFRTLGLRKAAMLYVNNDYGLGNSRSFEREFTRHGGTIVLAESFDEGANDVRPQLFKVKASRPDSIFVVGQGTEGGFVLKQAQEVGIKAQFLSTITIQRADVLQIAGDAANGLIFVVPAYDSNMSGRTQSFERRFKSRYLQSSDLFSANGYDALHIVVKAIGAGGYSSDGIKQAIFRIGEYAGVTGTTTFDHNGDVTKPVTTYQIQGGEFIDFQARPSVDKRRKPRACVSPHHFGGRSLDAQQYASNNPGPWRGSQVVKATACKAAIAGSIPARA